jgi:hypothetical protein
MLKLNTHLEYALLLLLSTGRRSFSALGRTINKRGEVVAKLLLPASTYITQMQKLAIKFFEKNKKLFVMIDETLLDKMYSEYMEGTGYFYDTKLKISYKAYKLILATVSNGSYTLPLECEFLFDPKLCTTPVATRLDFVLRIIKVAQKLFPAQRLIFVLDGAFATRAYLKWCLENEIETEVRMPSNRVVQHRGKQAAIRTIKALRPKGRQMARTIRAVWHGMSLFITAERRIDKHGVYSVVFQAATYKAKSSEHVAHYAARWGIEKGIRTTKQSCGIQDCYSTDLQIQLNHAHASLFAFALAQLERKKHNLLNPEAAIRSIKRRKLDFLNHYFARNPALNPDVLA